MGAKPRLGRPMSFAPDIKPETPTGMVANRDEYRRARQRVEELAGAQTQTPEGLELATLSAALRDYEARVGAPGGTKDGAGS